ncbi:hypothetical protein EB74_08645 [Mycobacterium sp. SWH-M5]|nr:hypothetical protein EB74_08645 [Mycobacterium sp. SWH-M5]
MHDLTIDLDGNHSTVSGYTDFEDAHRQLLSHAIAQDLYLHIDMPIRQDTTTTTYSLVKIDHSGQHRPQVVGTATIAPTPLKPAPSLHQSAKAALTWINHHDTTWRHGAHNDPGARYPLTVLTAAHAEARYLVAPGTIYAEAANLAEVDRHTPRPSQSTLENLRSLAAGLAHTPTPIDAQHLVDAVEANLPANTSPQQAAALIWCTALLAWGTTAP